MSDEIELTYQIPNGWVFRNLIEYLRNTNGKGTFKINKDGIMYSENSGHILNTFIIDASKLPMFKYSCEDEVITKSFSFAELCTILKSMEKKEQLIFFSKKGDRNIWMRRIGGTSSADNLHRIKLIDVETYNWETCNPEKIRDPNCVLTAQEFSRCCSELKSAKCLEIELKASRYGIMFVGCDAGKIPFKYLAFGSYEEPVKAGTVKTNQNGKGVLLTLFSGINKNNSIKIEPRVIGFLIKVNNLVPDKKSIIKVYHDEYDNTAVFKFIFSLGNMGEMSICLR